MPKASTSQVPKRVRLNAADRKAQIIAAAREVFIEQGINGARSRHIAERAAITEAYLYRHFHSKDEIYRLAVEEPLEQLVRRLRTETHELAERDDVSTADVLLRCHELLLACMVDVAPLVAAALFSNSGGKEGFYGSFLFPRLQAALKTVIPDITGFPLETFELDVFTEAMIGIHLTVALEHLLEEKPVDVPHVARQITEMFAPGVGRSSMPERRARTPRGSKRAARR